MKGTITTMNIIGNITIRKEEYDVIKVRHRGVFADIGRFLGGCEICGALTDRHCQCVKGGSHICESCNRHYIENWRGDGSYILPEHPQHPYHGIIT